MNLTGKVMVAFYTQTNKGNGWSADFYISSPINRHNENMLIMIRENIVLGAGVKPVFYASQS